MDAISLEGEIVIKALEVHRLHLESHGCGQCLNSYETTLKAITEWVKAHGGIESVMREKLEEVSNGGGKEKGGSERQSVGDSQGQKPKKESWDIFG